MLHDRGAMLTGLGIGIGLMYFMDPERGRRRRARVRDQVAHSATIGSDALGTTGRDVAHRATGAAARLRGTLRRGPIDDTVLIERVRAQLGRLVSHPRAITVEAHDGIVTLRGPILKAEAPRLLKGVGRVRGVREVVSALDEHEEAGQLPELQGGRTPSSSRPAIQWSPARRVLVGTAGTALTGYGVTRRDVPGTVLAAAGLGLLGRAATNLDTRRLTGIGARRRAEAGRDATQSGVR